MESVTEQLDETRMEEALRSASPPCRRNKFLTYILETPIPEGHLCVDDDELVLSCSVGTPQCGDPLIPECLQNVEDSGLEGEPSTRADENFSALEQNLSHSSSLEFLSRVFGQHCVLKTLRNKDMIRSSLLAMAECVRVLPPGNEPFPGGLLDMSRWRESLGALLNEMRIVEGSCAACIGKSPTPGVYVLTSSPYSAFLRALAMEIAD